MSDVFADRLLDAIDAKGSPICVGIDPVYEQLPDAVAGPAQERDANDAEAALDAIFEFTTAVLRAVAPHVPVVKFQSAYFERYLWDGVEAYYSLIAEAKDLGLLVIGDVKRGDIGSTSAAYAAAHLGAVPFEETEAATPDAITINPMLGLDAIDPFVKVARDEGKGLFVLVRTSNPGSADFQDVRLADGRTWSELVADRLAPIADDPAVGRRARHVEPRGRGRRDADAHDAEPACPPAALPVPAARLRDPGRDGRDDPRRLRQRRPRPGVRQPQHPLPQARRRRLEGRRARRHAGDEG